MPSRINKIIQSELNFRINKFIKMELKIKLMVIFKGKEISKISKNFLYFDKFIVI